MTEFPRFYLDRFVGQMKVVAEQSDEAAYAFKRHAAEIQVGRMRQCLAEVGWIHERDGFIYVDDDHLGDPVPTITWVAGSSAPSWDHLWRARELAEVGIPLCRIHHMVTYMEPESKCIAERRLIKDCREGLPF